MSVLLPNGGPLIVSSFERDLYANSHTRSDAATRFLWYFNEASGDAMNRGSVAGANLAVGAAVERRAILLSSLNGRGFAFPGGANSVCSGGVDTTPGVNTGITMWAIFTVTTPPTARRAAVFVRNTSASWVDPWHSLAIAIDSPTAPAPRSIIVEIGRASGGYAEHILPTPYTDGTQLLVGFSFDGSAWSTYLNGVVVATYSDAGDVDWGDGTGYWSIGANANPSDESAIIHVTEAGCAAEVWTDDQWIEAEQRRLGRWRG